MKPLDWKALQRFVGEAVLDQQYVETLRHGPT